MGDPKEDKVGKKLLDFGSKENNVDEKLGDSREDKLDDSTADKVDNFEGKVDDCC